MAAILPILCFIALLIGSAARLVDVGSWTRWRQAFITTLVIEAVVLTAFTEVLSIAQLLERTWLLGMWSLALLIASMSTVIALRQHPWPALPQLRTLPGLTRWCLIGALVIVVLTGITALAAPPNNWDSLTYHMARVANWIGYQSVAHYPTHFLPQIYQGPWAEFAILHMQILSGSDTFANLIQWVSLIGSIVTASLIARELAGDQRAQALAAVLAATIPMGIVQASSTQNDLTAGLWLMILMYAFLRLRAFPTWRSMLLVGSALGLALLTKATMYTYALPLMLWLGFWSLRQWRWAIWRPILAIGLVAVALNSGHYARNLDLFGNPLGLTPEESYHANQVITPAVVLSNAMRNTSLHLITPDKWVNAAIRVIIRILHIPLGLDMSDPRTTFGGMEFRQPPFGTNEDSSGNMIHCLLVMLTCGLLWKWQQRPSILVWYAVVMISGFLLFCATVVWMPWNSRLHTGLFLLWAPLIAIVLTRMLNPRLVTASAAVLLLAATPWVVQNETRPLVSSKPGTTVFTMSRIDQLFRARPELRDEYQETAATLIGTGCDRIGLISNDRDFWEYALWILIHNQASHRIQLEHLNVANISSQLYTRIPPLAPCAIVTVAVEQPDPLNIQGQSYRQVAQNGSLRVLTLAPQGTVRRSRAE